MNPTMQAPADPTAQPQQDAPEADENNPAFQKAMEFAMSALYEKKAALDVAQSIKLAKDPVEALANTAYEITSVVDEKTNGDVPDELMVLLASSILEEVAAIAEAAGVEVKGSTVGLAMKQMILRFLGENGVDTSQLQAAMDQVDPEEFNKIGGEQ